MSKLELTKKNGVMHDVIFCYVKMRDPALKFESETEKEFTVDCIVDEATAKKWKKAFKRNTPKEVETAKFEEIYKIEPPFEGDEQYIVKVKCDAQDSNGRIKSAKLLPNVFLDEGDNVRRNITDDVLVANGSAGKVAFNIHSNKFGTFPMLSGILVEDLIEYQEEANPFGGEVVGSRSDVGDNSSDNHSSGSEEQASKKPQEKSDNSDFDDDIPF